MTSILDNVEVLEETDTMIAYIDDGTLYIEDFEEYPLSIEDLEPVDKNAIDPENPKLEEFRALLFDTVYNQLDIREWVV